MLQAFEAELTVTETAIVKDTVAVCVSGEEILGFYRLIVEGEEAEVADCFVSPSALRQGVGAALMTHLKEAALAKGVKRLEVQSDPFAEGFYLALGYTRFSQSPSGSVPDRYLPLLELVL